MLRLCRAWEVFLLIQRSCSGREVETTLASLGTMSGRFHDFGTGAPELRGPCPVQASGTKNVNITMSAAPLTAT